MELEDFGAVANVDEDTKSQNTWSTNIEVSPMVEQHSFEQTVRNISDLVHTGSYSRVQDRHSKRRSPSDCHDRKDI